MRPFRQLPPLVESHDWIERVEAKLAWLRQVDAQCVLFGAGTHRYRVSPPIDQHLLAEFESRLGSRVPTELCEFWSQIGGRGAGPAYGIKSPHECSAVRGEVLIVPGAHPHSGIPTGTDEELIGFEPIDLPLEPPALPWPDGHPFLVFCSIGHGDGLAVALTGPGTGKVFTLAHDGHRGPAPDDELHDCLIPRNESFRETYERWLDEGIAKLRHFWDRLVESEDWDGFMNRTGRNGGTYLETFFDVPAPPGSFNARVPHWQHLYDHWQRG